MGGGARRCSCSGGQLFYCPGAGTGRDGRPDRTGGAAHRAARRGGRGAPATAFPQRGCPGPQDFLAPGRRFRWPKPRARPSDCRTIFCSAPFWRTATCAAEPAAAELAAWLTRFGDQPEAPAIRGLLERLAPGATASRGSRFTAAGTPGGAARSAAAPRSLFVQNRDAEAVAAARMRPADARGAACRRPGRAPAWPERCRRVVRGCLPRRIDTRAACGGRLLGRPRGAARRRPRADSPSGCAAPRWKAIRSMA